MINVGIDVGAKNIKIVVLRDGEIIGKGISLAGFETKETTKILFDETIKQAGITPEQIDSITSTGSGRKAADFAKFSVTEVTAATKGATSLFPSVRCVIDVGAEEGRTIRCDTEGKIIDFALNEKCAAGAGAFIEAMSRALEIPVEDFGMISLQSDKEIPLNAQCAVFAESEVVSLLHAKTEKKDIAKSVNDAVASRITSMARKVGFEKDIELIGGMAKNTGFVQSLKKALESEIIIPENPEFISAYGAALINE
ncbi:MAG: CoA activase [Ignavibacteria bacterium GWB2_35_12]|nr:MAG: CoA activase [Ignavibacteria bacterium GWB2_35_12]OGU92205.1 MAG: CoA activase [Ignavibacteria bacterium RIFOXYA2_FULL_35_10]OGV22548.1 MAG: CoA activase [Ignavibacteria bacterium RIFOXYC2_FULL_35_21]